MKRHDFSAKRWKAWVLGCCGAVAVLCTEACGTGSDDCTELISGQTYLRGVFGNASTGSSGNAARLSVSASGGQLVFHCGIASLSGPIRLDSAGRFETTGQLWQSSGAGPPPMGTGPQSVRYSGQIIGSTLSLTVRFSDGTPSRGFSMGCGGGADPPACY